MALYMLLAWVRISSSKERRPSHCHLPPIAKACHAACRVPALLSPRLVLRDSVPGAYAVLRGAVPKPYAPRTVATGPNQRSRSTPGPDASHRPVVSAGYDNSKYVNGDSKWSARPRSVLGAACPTSDSDVDHRTVGSKYGIGDTMRGGPLDRSPRRSQTMRRAVSRPPCSSDPTSPETHVETPRPYLTQIRSASQALQPR